MGLKDFADSIVPYFTEKRLELRNTGSRFNTLLLLSNNEHYRPERLQTADGECVLIHNHWTTESITLQTVGAGTFSLRLMGMRKMCAGKLLNLPTRYSSVALNDRKVDVDRICTCEQPFEIRCDVLDRTILKLTVASQPVDYGDALPQMITDLYQDHYKRPLSPADHAQLLELVTNGIAGSRTGIQDFAQAEMLLNTLVANYRCNIWPLRRQIRANTGLLNRDLYLKAYYEILRRDGGWIGIQAAFATVPSFPHGTHGVFISNGARIGRNCTIFQHVTIGSNKLKQSKTYGFPRIGDNVLIGTGAKIIGGVKIGNNVRIGAGCTVVHDVADNTTVVQHAPRHIGKG